MSLADTVKQDLTTAMKAGEKDRVGALRLVLSELQKAAKEGDGDELAVLRRERKRRLESATAFRDAGRDELADGEEAEARMIETYLPAQLDDGRAARDRRGRGRRDRRHVAEGHGRRHEGRDGQGRRPRRRQARLRARPGGARCVARSSSPTRRRRSSRAAATPSCARSRATSTATCSCAATSSRSTASRRPSRRPRSSCASSPSSSSRATRSRPGTIAAVTGALDQHHSPAEILEDVVWRHRSKQVAPKTVNQKRYVDSIRRNTITFGIGPAGTGKTFLAVALAAAALSRREVNRIILTRPAVEAGERLGFLPGDLMAKIDPYLRPLFDALHDMLDAEKVAAYLERGQIEVAPLAFMRGRTLNDTFIILDEAQNTTPEQMKMFLTRLGFGSKMVVTGDVTQIDLPKNEGSGLVVVGDILEGIEGIEFVRFGGEDVVRHRLVQRIVEAYAEHAERQTPELRPADRRRA